MASAVRGYLSQKEMDFLAMAAACPTATGVMLEIGSFMGKSTIILAEAGRVAGDSHLVAVDPLTYRPHKDPLFGKEDCLKEFTANLRGAGVEELVEFHQMVSQGLAPGWKRKIRFLWIDGDHSYEGAKNDFDLFSSHLADGAIVALHDMMKHDIGPLRVFAEDILLSRNFGAAGVCGSIGWGQYRTDPQDCEAHLRKKLKLYQRISPMIPYACLDTVDHGTGSFSYKLLRSRVPHGPVDPGHCVQEVALVAA
jgi:hypothetical protein